MGNTERRAVGLLVAMVAVFAPGFLLHAAPRFPGSLVGGLLGIAAATVFLLLLAYTAVKRTPWLKRHVALGAMLSFHAYAGAVGAAFGILHTGHKYQSPLGIALVSAMLIVVLSGFAGRHYLAQLGTDLRDQQRELGALRTRYDRMVADPAAAPMRQDIGVGAMVAGIADLEQAIGKREALKRVLSRWTVLHVTAAIVLYPLLAMHIWSGVYYGLRWWP